MLPVTKIQHFCTGDGPGVRTTVFLKGCPLRCLWCHNPETQSTSAQFFYADHLCIRCGACAQVCPADAHRVTNTAHTIDRAVCGGCMKCADACPAGALEACAQLLSAEEILRRVLKDAVFYGNGGGVTFSGGEPTVHAEELIPLLQRLRRQGVHTALETCGYFAPSILPALASAVDLFLWDVKDTDPARHIANTGVSNDRILSNLKAADAFGAKTVLRCILLKTINLNEAHLQGIVSVFQSLTHCEGVELLPYHTYGASKNAALERPGAAHPEWVPAAEDMRRAETWLRQYAPVIQN